MSPGRELGQNLSLTKIDAGGTAIAVPGMAISFTSQTTQRVRFDMAFETHGSAINVAGVSLLRNGTPLQTNSFTANSSPSTQSTGNFHFISVHFNLLSGTNTFTGTFSVLQGGGTVSMTRMQSSLITL